MVEVMWFVRGAQSAIFYYVACTPCTDVKYRRKRRKEAAQSRAERQVLEKEQPHFIPQPLPFSTNVHWQEEVTSGPGPPVKRGHGPREPISSRTGSRKGVGSSGQGSSTGTSSAETTKFGHNVLPTFEGATGAMGLGRFNSSRYQREDEELWGDEHNMNGPGKNGRPFHKREGSSVGLPGRGRAGTGGSGRYCASRNPAVNELHPAVVSSPSVRRGETRWMLQPPPPAKVMEGKESVSRSNRSRGSTMKDGETEVRPDRLPGEKNRTQNANNFVPDIPTSQEHDFRHRSSPGHGHNKDQGDYHKRTRPYTISASHASKDFPADLEFPADTSPNPRQPPPATIRATLDAPQQLRSSHRTDPTFATSPLSSETTLTSPSQSTHSFNFLDDHDHANAMLPHTRPINGPLGDVLYLGDNEIRFSGKALKNTKENGKLLRDTEFGSRRERYGSDGNGVRFWRWSMDI